MKMFTIGARGSRLSLAQTRAAAAFLEKEFPGTRYRLVPVETPGDRDLTTPIDRSAPDFFTRDLDTAVREGRIDFAVHSAKDLPPVLAPDLDWFWLPNREDPRDAWVTRAPLTPARRRAALKVGISSARRESYARAYFPKAKLLPIRGAIDARIQQVVDGKYDAVLMAMAGLNRLYPELPAGVAVEPIPLADLEPPEAQGYLAVVFRAGDARLVKMREKFVKAVRFVSAGVGDDGLCTRVGARDLAQADVVLYDDLMGPELLAALDLRQQPKLVHVGKRCGAHSMKQAEITQLLCDEARKGRRVVRLKGGDAGLFGRLAEETDALAALQIPFWVRPGVSALTAATTGTGLLLTRRGESTGFTVYTPRRAADASGNSVASVDAAACRVASASSGTAAPNPLVMFMATKVAHCEAQRLLAEGWAAQTPCALVWDAAGPREDVAVATLGALAASADVFGTREEPGLFIVGSAAAHRWPKLGFFQGRRVLVTASDAVQEKAAVAIEDRGGKPVRWPLIRLVPRATCAGKGRTPADYDAIVLTSPSSVRLFFAAWKGDLRRLPAFYTCGAGTDAELRKHGVASDVMPAQDFSAAGLIAEIVRMNLKGRRVLRLRSAKAGAEVARALKKAGAQVDDVVLYDNVFTAPAAKLPPFDDVYFASASAVESFVAQYGAAKLRGKGLYVMGLPTKAALAKVTKRACTILSIV